MGVFMKKIAYIVADSCIFCVLFSYNFPSSVTEPRRECLEPATRVFASGEDTLTCRLQASLTRLRGVCEPDSVAWPQIQIRSESSSSR